MHARLRAHGWLWMIIGSLMLLALLWERPEAITAPTLAVLGLGTLDVAAGALVLRRAEAGRALLILTVIGHLALAAWLWHRGQMLAASIKQAPTHGNYQQMIAETAGNAMLGTLAWVTWGLAAVSTLLSVWTAVVLVRSR